MCEPAIGKKWCNYCRSAQPEEGFALWQGKHNKTAMCSTCIAARRSRQGAAARDAFGKTITERNAAEVSRKNGFLTEMNQKRKQQQVKDQP